MAVRGAAGWRSSRIHFYQSGPDALFDASGRSHLTLLHQPPRFLARIVLTVSSDSLCPLVPGRFTTSFYFPQVSGSLTTVMLNHLYPLEQFGSLLRSAVIQ